MLWSWWAISGLLWVWRNRRGPHLEGRQDLRLPLRFVLRQQCPCSIGAGESGLVLSEEGNSACLSSCSGSLSPLVELCAKPRVFPDDARECQCPSVLFLHSQGGLRRGVRASGSPQLRTGKSGSFNMGHKPQGLSRISSRGRPHPEGRRAGREPLPDLAGESTLLSRTGEE